MGDFGDPGDLALRLMRPAGVVDELARLVPFMFDRPAPSPGALWAYWRAAEIAEARHGRPPTREELRALWEELARRCA